MRQFKSDRHAFWCGVLDGFLIFGCGGVIVVAIVAALSMLFN